jgi:hypothetical protein
MDWLSLPYDSTVLRSHYYLRPHPHLWQTPVLAQQLRGGSVVAMGIYLMHAMRGCQALGEPGG